MENDRNLYNEETHTETGTTEERKPHESKTGSDHPGGDGNVSDEQVNAIDNDGSGRETGQDHSTDREGEQDPTEGVGAVEDSSIRTRGRADISD
jgi:hypothetical protein